MRLFHLCTKLCLTTSALLFSACGPKIWSSLDKDQHLPASVAVLPANYTSDLPRERIDYIRGSVMSELRNANFVVVDDKVINAMCSSPDCPERGALADKYLIDGFITLKIDSLSRNNFIAGYYNTLTGELRVADRKDKVLTSVTHTESERGGVLFESGQLLQGIISQVKNSGEAAFDNLANKFTHTLIESLPARPLQNTPSSSPEGTELAIKSATETWDGPAARKICVSGTPLSFASVLIAQERSTLREVAPGEYCGSFATISLPVDATTITVELRSAFGNSVRKDLPSQLNVECAQESRFALINSQSPPTLQVKCATIGTNISAVLSPGCTEALPPCRSDRVIVFQAPSSAGPFSKIAEVTRSSIALPRVEGTIQIVSISSGERPSLPIELSASTQPK